jgi:hypothetical protein
MNTLRSAFTWIAAGVGMAAGAYAIYAGLAWSRYGHVTAQTGGEDADALLDTFMPSYDVVERHHVRVAAPAAVTFAAAAAMDLQQAAIVRAIFKGREWIMGSRAADKPVPRAFLAQMRAIGWGTLAEIPGREIVMGAVTQPWMADVVFRAVPAERFAAFDEPDYVKIVWTLRSDPVGDAESVFRTETRVATTNPTARAKFRWYWSFASPGIIVIRRMSLGVLKADAEGRYRGTRLTAAALQCS